MGSWGSGEIGRWGGGEGELLLVIVARVDG